MEKNLKTNNIKPFPEQAVSETSEILGDTAAIVGDLAGRTLRTAINAGSGLLKGVLGGIKSGLDESNLVR